MVRWLYKLPTNKRKKRNYYIVIRVKNHILKDKLLLQGGEDTFAQRVVLLANGKLLKDEAEMDEEGFFL